jgi:hypothetical protein
MNPYTLYTLADGVGRIRSWLWNPADPEHSVAHNMATDAGTELMIDLETTLLRVETLLNAVADGERSEHGLMNEVRGLLTLAVQGELK